MPYIDICSLTNFPAKIASQCILEVSCERKHLIMNEQAKPVTLRYRPVPPSEVYHGLVGIADNYLLQRKVLHDSPSTAPGVFGTVPVQNIAKPSPPANPPPKSRFSPPKPAPLPSTPVVIVKKKDFMDTFEDDLDDFDFEQIDDAVSASQSAARFRAGDFVYLTAPSTEGYEVETVGKICRLFGDTVAVDIKGQRDFHLGLQSPLFTHRGALTIAVPMDVLEIWDSNGEEILSCTVEEYLTNLQSSEDH